MSGPADRLRQIPPERIWLEVDDLDSARAGLRRLYQLLRAPHPAPLAGEEDRV